MQNQEHQEHQEKTAKSGATLPSQLESSSPRDAPVCAGCEAARTYLAARDALAATSFGTTRRHHIVAFDQALAALRVALASEEARRGDGRAGADAFTAEDVYAVYAVGCWDGGNVNRPKPGEEERAAEVVGRVFRMRAKRENRISRGKVR